MLCIEVKQLLSEKSDRVECVDFHQAEPWVLSALSTGEVIIWDFARQVTVERFEVCDAPVRCARFVASERWVVAASDDMLLRVFDYALPELVREVEAHDDYIRFLAVHPSMPQLLSCSDDASVKLWDWSKDWQCCQVFEGHTHNVAMCQWSPDDPVVFASCSADQTVRVWRADADADGPVDAQLTLEGHAEAVTSIAFGPAGQERHLASGAADRTVRLWDYASGQCLRTLQGHSSSVTALAFHPAQPLLLTGSEDRTVQIRHLQTLEVEETWDHRLGGVLSLAVLEGRDAVAVGHEQGTAVAELRAEPAVVVTLHVLREGPEGWEVHYGTASAAELKALRVDGSQKLAGFKAQLAERLEVPERKLRLFLPGGRLLGDADGWTPLAGLLGEEYAEM